MKIFTPFIKMWLQIKKNLERKTAFKTITKEVFPSL